MTAVRSIILGQLFVLAVVLGPGSLPALACDTSMYAGRMLKSASEPDYPPFALVRPDGSAAGFSVDLLKAVVKIMGLEVDIPVGPWHEIKQELAEGRLDVLPLVAYSPERDRIFDFTVSYLEMHGAIFVRKGEKVIRDEEDLRGREVLVMRGDAAHEYAIKENLSSKLILTDTFAEAMRLLSVGRHDAVVCQYLMGLQLIKKLGITNVVPVAAEQEQSLKPTGRRLTGFAQKFCFAVPDGDEDLLAVLNEGLALVFANGTYEELYNKWFAPILPKPPVPLAMIIRSLLLVFVPVLFLLAVFGVWYLRREVAKKTDNLRDQIKHRKQIEADLLLAKKTAEDASRAKSEFLANMSHEIRTPMNAIMGMTRLVLESELTSEQRHYLAAVQQSADLLLNIINDILDFSKVEAGQLDLREQSFDLEEVILSTVEQLEVRAKEKGLELSVELSPRIHNLLIGDDYRLRQILFNLIGNAVKFTDSGRIIVNAEMLSEDEKEIFLKFSVADTGPGIPTEVQDKIFDSFVQADSGITRPYGGTGLGLAISKRLAALFDGDLWVESEPGCGSTFYLTASFKKDAKPKEKSAVIAKEIKPPETLIAGSLNILLIDDDRFNLDLLRIILEKAGPAVTLGCTGLEALELLVCADFDLVMMDLQMPVMDGITATRYIRQCELGILPDTIEHQELLKRLGGRLKGTYTPIIAITAHAMSEDRERCFAAGMDDYVTKPFQTKELFATLGRVIRPAGLAAPPEKKSAAPSKDKTGPDIDAAEVKEYLRELYQLSPEKIDIIFEEGRETLKKEIARGKEALSLADLQLLGKSVHKMKGVLLSMGLDSLADLAQEIEDRQSQTGDAGLEEKFRQLCRGIEPLLED